MGKDQYHFNTPLRNIQMANLENNRFKESFHAPFSNFELGEIIDSRPLDPLRCPSRHCNKLNCKKPWHRPYSKTNVVEKLRPVLVFTSWAMVVSGTVLVAVVANYAVEFDSMYGVEKSKLISLMSSGGLIAMAVSGTVLLTSVLLDKRSIMWFYMIASTFICVYIFALSVVMIQYGLYNAPVLAMNLNHQTSEAETIHTTGQSRLLIPGLTIPYVSRENNFLLSKAFIIGILTLLGSGKLSKKYTNAPFKVDLHKC